MRVLIWFSLLASAFLLVLFPFAFGELLIGSLAKLHLSRSAALSLVIAIVAGGAINIPVKRLAHTEDVAVHPLAIFGLFDLWPQLRRVRRETVIAVNVGGCAIPTALAIYQLVHLAALGLAAVVAAGAASLVNIGVCYTVARPVPGLGIAMPGLVPAIVAAVMAMLFAPDQAAPVAFVAGVAGPLVGADLLHLKDISKLNAGMASIGGAGTFDGIVLSGIVAAYLS